MSLPGMHFLNTIHRIKDMCQMDRIEDMSLTELRTGIGLDKQNF